MLQTKQLSRGKNPDHYKVLKLVTPSINVRQMSSDKINYYTYLINKFIFKCKRSFKISKVLL